MNTRTILLSCCFGIALLSTSFGETWWLTYGSSTFAKGLINLDWYAASDKTKTVTGENTDDSYVVAANATIYVGANEKAVFLGGPLTIGDLDTKSAGTVFQYYGTLVSGSTDATFANGVTLARGDWKTHYGNANTPYHVYGDITVTATEESPFVFWRDNASAGELRFHQKFGGSGYVKVFPGNGSNNSLSFALALLGDYSDFSGSLTVASADLTTDSPRIGGLQLASGVCAGTINVGTLSRLYPVDATTQVSVGTLNLAADSKLEFSLQMRGTGDDRTRTCNTYTATAGFSAEDGARLVLAFDDDANGQYTDSFDLLTVPLSATLDEQAFDVLANGIDDNHADYTLSVRTGTTTKTLVITFNGTGVKSVTLNANTSNNTGISGATWSDGSTGTSAETGYIVRGGKVLYISSSSDLTKNAFNGEFLRIGDAHAGTDGYVYQYGGFNLDNPVSFGETGLILARGKWYTRYADHTYGIGGPVTVTAFADAPFRFFCNCDALSKGTLTLLGALKGSGALQVDAGFNANAGCTNFTLRLVGDASAFTGSIRVVGQTGDLGSLCHANLLLPSGLMPARVAIDANATLIGPATGTTTLKDLTLADGAELVFSAAVAADGSTRTAGTIAVTDAFAAAGRLKIFVNLAQTTATGGDFDLLTLPDGVTLDPANVEIRVPANQEFACRDAEVKFVDGHLRYCVPESTVVSMTSSDVTSEVRQTTDYQSAQTNAAQWSDGLLPHADADYLVASTTKVGMGLRTPSYDATFPGRSLSIRGTSDKEGVLTVVSTNFTASAIRFLDYSQLYSNYSGVPSVTVHAPVHIEGNATYRPYAGGLLRMDGAMTGSGHLSVTGNALGSSNPGGDVEFLCASPNFAGRLTVTMGYAYSGAKHAPSDIVTAYGQRMFTRLFLNDGANVGGAMNPADPLGVVIENFTQVIPRQSITVSESTRGWHIGTNGRFLINEGVTMTMRSPLSFEGALWKQGAGTLVLGNGQPTFGTTGLATVPSEIATNREFRVIEGNVRIENAYALNGLDIIQEDAQSRFILDAQTADETLATYGLIDVLTPGEPFAINDEKSATKIVFGLACETKPTWSSRTLALCTVAREKAESAAALLKAVKASSGISVSEITPVETTLGETETTTFRVTVTRANGLILLLK